METHFGLGQEQRIILQRQRVEHVKSSLHSYTSDDLSNNARE